MNGATPHVRRPTVYCATRSASAIPTDPDPFTSPHKIVIVVVLVVVDVVVVVVVGGLVVVVVGAVVLVVVVGRVVVVDDVVVVVVGLVVLVVVVVGAVVVVVVGNVPFDSYAPMSHSAVPSWLPSSGRANAPIQVWPEGQSAFLQHAVAVVTEQ